MSGFESTCLKKKCMPQMPGIFPKPKKKFVLDSLVKFIYKRFKLIFNLSNVFKNTKFTCYFLMVNLHCRTKKKMQKIHDKKTVSFNQCLLFHFPLIFIYLFK